MLQARFAFFGGDPGANPWHPSNTAELRRLIAGHYSRRRTPRPGVRLGGIGAPQYLASDFGSAWIAVWQLGKGWGATWRDWPSWWVSLFRRAPADPVAASELVSTATRAMLALQPGPAYTAIDTRRIRPSTSPPGLCFLRAGWRYHCSTRPLQRWRSLLILHYCP